MELTYTIKYDTLFSYKQYVRQVIIIFSETVLLIGAGTHFTVSKDWNFVDTVQTCRIYYVHDGQASYHYNTELITLQKGYLYFFPPNLPFQAYSDLKNPLTHTFFDFLHCLVFGRSCIEKELSIMQKRSSPGRKFYFPSLCL